jgi:hypothetical protein
MSCGATGPRPAELMTGPATPGRRPFGEALALYPKDVDPVRGIVPVLHAKGDKARTRGPRPRGPHRRRALGRPAPLIRNGHG